MTKQLRKLYPLLPQSFRRVVARRIARSVHRRYRNLELTDVFDRIYSADGWGTGSGFGSYGEFQDRYCEMLPALFERFGVTTIADLGCGDFAIGRRIAPLVQRYTGVDVSKTIIDRNARSSVEGRIEFLQADATRDVLPKADAAVLRQVLQHLSNDEVVQALDNVFKTYPVALVTEHVYIGPGGVPNLDMTHGPGTRVLSKSGVFIDTLPFLTSHSPSVVRDIPVGRDEVLRTWVVITRASTAVSSTVPPKRD
jgi:SAM-dependent methyltransferase